MQGPSAAGTEENHHIQRKGNTWQLRIVIDQGALFVGARMKIGLRTSNEAEARARRDVVIHALGRAMMLRGWPNKISGEIEPTQ